MKVEGEAPGRMETGVPTRESAGRDAKGRKPTVLTTKQYIFYFTRVGEEGVVWQALGRARRRVPGYVGPASSLSSLSRFRSRGAVGFALLLFFGSRGGRSLSSLPRLSPPSA